MNSTALLIIDVQNGFINENTRHIPQLAEQKQMDYDFVWAAQLEYGQESPFITIRKLSGFNDTSNPTGLAFIPQPDVRTILKHGYSAATPKLLEELRNHHITQIDLMGIDTDQCVLATALALFDANITPRLLANCCASTGGSKMHEYGLAIMRRALGDHNVMA
jgi:nicotinamidase-related amidase